MILLAVILGCAANARIVRAQATAASSNFQNAPYNWKNAPDNWDNQPSNFKNAPYNFENAPYNFNQRNGLYAPDGVEFGYQAGRSYFDMDGERIGYETE